MNFQEMVGDGAGSCDTDNHHGASAQSAAQSSTLTGLTT